MPDEKNFFAGLFDFAFHHLLTRRIVKLLYILSILGGGITLVVCVVRPLAIRALERPQEERREPRVCERLAKSARS